MTTRGVLDPAVVERLRQLTPPGEPDVLKEILSVFLNEVPRRIDRLKAAWREGQAADVQRAAHSLTGSSGNIGADALSEVCRAIDERSKAGELRSEELQDLISALDREYGRVEAEIKRLLSA
ncbi:MAG TPA: Hpt domain-containing protein [Vicinamibacterales bacterium]|nr:Hpt domain-containing protein [Vicinamibacterales bacterium]